MGNMAVMGVTGDTKLIWDAENEAEVDAARELFKNLKKKNYLAYSVGKKGKTDELINKFDPDLERIIMVPPVVGG